MELVRKQIEQAEDDIAVEGVVSTEAVKVAVLRPNGLKYIIANMSVTWLVIAAMHMLSQVSLSGSSLTSLFD